MSKIITERAALRRLERAGWGIAFVRGKSPGGIVGRKIAAYNLTRPGRTDGVYLAARDLVDFVVENVPRGRPGPKGRDLVRVTVYFSPALLERLDRAVAAAREILPETKRSNLVAGIVKRAMDDRDGVPDFDETDDPTGLTCSGLPG